MQNRPMIVDPEMFLACTPKNSRDCMLASNTEADWF